MERMAKIIINCKGESKTFETKNDIKIKNKKHVSFYFFAYFELLLTDDKFQICKDCITAFPPFENAAILSASASG